MSKIQNHGFEPALARSSGGVLHRLQYTGHQTWRMDTQAADGGWRVMKDRMDLGNLQDWAMLQRNAGEHRLAQKLGVLISGSTKHRHNRLRSEARRIVDTECKRVGGGPGAGWQAYIKVRVWADLDAEGKIELTGVQFWHNRFPEPYFWASGLETFDDVMNAVWSEEADIWVWNFHRGDIRVMVNVSRVARGLPEIEFTEGFSFDDDPPRPERT